MFFFIPGILIAILTFPGVIVHELAHQLACRIMKVPVFEVCYFRFQRPNGYVIHENPKNLVKTIIISMGPFIVNTFLGVIIFISGKFSIREGALEYFLMWLGISIIMHAFSSQGDLDHIFKGLKEKGTPIFMKVLVYPFAYLMYIGTVGKVFWLDLGYSLGVVYLMEKLILI